MSLVVLTGGARSGKSSAAQRLASARSVAVDGGPVTVAVFGRASDAEMQARISAHQESRPERFVTLEVTEPEGWLQQVGQEPLLLVDCLGTLLGLVMEHVWDLTEQDGLGKAPSDALPTGYAEEVQARFLSQVERLAGRAGDTIVVTNEVGLGPVPEWASGRLFRDLLGVGNRTLVASADAAYLYVCGRAIDLLDCSPQAHWPDD